MYRHWRRTRFIMTLPIAAGLFLAWCFMGDLEPAPYRYEEPEHEIQTNIVPEYLPVEEPLEAADESSTTELDLYQRLVHGR